MQIEQFQVRNLFGAFERVIPFQTHGEEEQALSLVLLHGPNGSGKTTSLRMIDGFMRLEFDVFREVPFGQSTLRFNSGDEISVSQDDLGQPLQVRFGDCEAVLHPDHPGALEPSGVREVHQFREAFLVATQKISFEYIHTWRLTPPEDEIDPELLPVYRSDRRRDARRRRRRSPSLAERVARFIADAQVNYRRFFRSNEPDFLSAIIEQLKAGTQPDTTPEQLILRLTQIRSQEDAHERLGVERTHWDFKLARSYLEQMQNLTGVEGLSVMTAATEVLESRAREQELVAERLLTFERTINSYFRDKKIHVEPRKGFVISRHSDEQLSEESLSSGEYHLLYLMVSALTTQRRGTVLAIDEPELSMHMSWQRRLIDSLLECASNASPQLLLATHSPDIVGGYRDYLVEFGNTDELR